MSVNAFDAYCIGWPPCMRQAPKPLDDGSTWTSTCAATLKYLSSGVFRIRVLISSKALGLFSSQINAVLFFSRARIGSDLVDKSSEILRGR